jgi:hypothetical protein
MLMALSFPLVCVIPLQVQLLALRTACNPQYQAGNHRRHAATMSEKIVIEQQTEQIINDFHPATVTTDNSYAQAMRIRQWAKRWVALLTPACKWTKGRYAKAYHNYINQPEQPEPLSCHPFPYHALRRAAAAGSHCRQVTRGCRKEGLGLSFGRDSVKYKSVCYAFPRHVSCHPTSSQH